MRRLSKGILSLFVAGFTLTGCGSGPKNVDGESQDGASLRDGNSEFIKVPVGVSRETSGLYLVAAADSYKISLEGCASGYSSIITEATAAMDVYKFDLNCLGKLTELTVGGITYIPDVNFTTWLSGDTAKFKDNGAGNLKLDIAVTSQLDNPISGSVPVTYSFKEIQAGSDTTLSKDDVSDGHTLSVGGEAAPAFIVKSYAFNNITAAGEGQFTFTMECDGENIAGAGATATCKGQNMVNDVKYKLVEDTFGGTLTLANAEALFPAGESSVASADILAVGAGGTVNGGFNTSLLTGPATMHNKPNMILILQVSDTSYRYFNIDVTTL